MYVQAFSIDDKLPVPIPLNTFNFSSTGDATDISDCEIERILGLLF